MLPRDSASLNNATLKLRYLPLGLGPSRNVCMIGLTCCCCACPPYNVRRGHSSRNNTPSSSVLKEYCNLLGVSEKCDYQELKMAFVHLAKKYHPDSVEGTADASKFAEVEVAYRALKKNMTGSDSTDDAYETLEKNHGIKHTVPQHRQYLSYDGIGYGTPSQRQKQYDQQKVSKAMENIHDFKTQKHIQQFEKSLVQKDAALARQFKSRQAMERLVEDLILESMRRGDFNNLPGSGKPLKYAPENPYVDSMTHKLNQILINNGFTPEWIALERDICEMRDDLRKELTRERAKYGSYPLMMKEEEASWQQAVERLRETTKRLNGMIDKFNMIVPMSQKQKIHFQLEKVATDIIQKEPTRKVNTKIFHKTNTGTETNTPSMLDVLWKFFK